MYEQEGKSLRKIAQETGREYLNILTPFRYFFIEDFTAKTIEAVLDERAIPETEREILYNTSRFSLGNIFAVVRGFGRRSMRPAFAPHYPYWENAARMVEDYLSIILITIILLLILPTSLFTYSLFSLLRYLNKSLIESQS